ncbi:hypothetical protein ACQ86O_20225 [Serratia sp. L9]|uniref:hypothetical protein n=1 Tax=Serratia sp. L9 TaxID=3423946 RepID=UPI003D6698EC
MDNNESMPSDRQGELVLFPVKEKEVDGIQMGVLNDGTPYLTMRGLSRLCGVSHKAIDLLTTEWLDVKQKPRGQKVDAILVKKGLRLTKLFWNLEKNGTDIRAYPASVCMAILEYYAFDAEQVDNETAKANYRALAESTLKRFIYLSVGIDPENPHRGAWQAFQDRLQLNSQVPFGFFSVFSEMADLSLKMINTGFNFGPTSVPDISVGIFWGKHWVANELNQKYGDRAKHAHTYPDWFPQHKAGPIDAWIYPDDALGEFRRWMQQSYLPTKFPAYIESKARDGSIPQINSITLLSQVKKPEPPKLN